MVKSFFIIKMWPVFDCIMLTGTCTKYECVDILLDS